MVAMLLSTAREGLAYSNAWVTPWEAFTSESWECFSEINPFALAFDERNAVFKAYPGLLERSLAAKLPRVKIVPTIVNDVFASNGKDVQTLKSVPVLTYWLADPGNLARHVEDLVAAARPYDGLEIDYEKVPDSLWENYTVLLAKLGQRLRSEGKTLAVDVEPNALYRKRGMIAAKYWPLGAELRQIRSWATTSG